MQLPFPGMDPYIESCGLWYDFHENLINEIQRQLADRVPDQYVVRAGEREYIALEPREIDEGKRQKRAEADVGVLQARPRRATNGSTATEVLEKITTEPAPVDMSAFVEAEYREVFIEISAVSPKRKLVTTIEVLSISNKRFGSEGWDLYTRKRRAHLAGLANLVEIDLLRQGQRMPMADEWPFDPYYILVARKQRPNRCKVWPAHYLRPLPVVPVPLLPPDPDVPLALQPMIEPIYRRARYEYDIDYSLPCKPPMSALEAKWLEKRLRGLKKNK